MPASAHSRPSRIVVIGASAGGMEPLKRLLSGMPSDFSGALLLVLHIPPQGPSLLARIMDEAGPLPASDAVDGLRIQAGHVYIAVPDQHLLVDGAFMRLSRGPKENRFRPAVDALFRSAAYTQGARVIGVVLSGQLDDGTSGLWAIKDRGGTSIVQSPRDAQHGSMPMSALQHVKVDHVVDVAVMPGLLSQLSREPMPQAAESPAAGPLDDMTQSGISSMAMKTVARAQGSGIGNEAGPWSPFTCPECQGVLAEVREGTILRFRCHTGHAFSMQTLLAAEDESIDGGLWNVLRALQEQAMLLREAEAEARAANNPEAAELERRARDCERKRDVIQSLLQDQKDPNAQPAAPASNPNR